MRVDRDRIKAGLLLAGTVAFAVLAQYYFQQRRAFLWDGVIFFSVALLLFVWLLAAATQRFRKGGRKHVLTRHTRKRELCDLRQAALVGLAIILNLIASRSANARPAPVNYMPSALLWLSSLGLMYAACLPVRASERGMHGPSAYRRVVRGKLTEIARNRSRTVEIGLVCGLVLAGFLLRIWNLEHIPANLSGDEGTQGMWAVGVFEGRVRNPFTTGWFSVPTMSFYAQAASLRLFGDNVAGLRTVSALFGTATLVFTYLLARRGLGRRAALLTLVALTFNHYHIHFSRLGSNQIADALFMVLTLWLLGEGLRRTSRYVPRTQAAIAASATGARTAQLWFLAAGMTTGLSWYGYFGSRVITMVVAVFLILQAVTERGFVRRNRRGLTIMALMAVMVASPLLMHYVNFPEDFSARFNQVSFFRWLDNELSLPEHDSRPTLIIRQLWRSISAFHYTLDPTFWYRSQIPLLDFVSGILFLLGFVIAIAQRRKPFVRLILIWMGLAILFGWLLTENPPSSMRMVIVTPAVAMLVGFGLDRLLILGRWALGGTKSQWRWISTGLLAFAAALNVYYYFVVYTPTRVFGNPSAETATVLARYLKETADSAGNGSASDDIQPNGTRPFVYFFGPPFLYYDFGTIRFIARDVPGISVPPRSEEPDFHADTQGSALFVFLRERIDELPMIQDRYPNGHIEEFRSDADGRLMFVVYKAPK